MIPDIGDYWLEGWEVISCMIRSKQIGPNLWEVTYSFEVAPI